MNLAYLLLLIFNAKLLVIWVPVEIFFRFESIAFFTKLK